MIRRRHRGIAGMLASMTFVVAMMAGCTTRAEDDLDYLRVVVDGQRTFGVSQKAKPPKAVVVYFHGLDADENVVMSDAKHTAFTTTLVDAGYAVVASRAGGNSFGNSSSRRNYSELAAAARSHYRVRDVYFVAESMGAIAAVDLSASTPDPALRGMVGISPALNLQSASANYRSAVDAALGTETIGSADPMNVPVDALRGKKMRLYVTPADTVVPTAQHATLFAEKFGSVADISMEACSGDHVDPSCFRGDDVVEWFDELASP